MAKSDVFFYEDEAGDSFCAVKFDDGDICISNDTLLPALLHPENVKALIKWLQEVSADDES